MTGRRGDRLPAFLAAIPAELGGRVFMHSLECVGWDMNLTQRSEMSFLRICLFVSS